MGHTFQFEIENKIIGHIYDAAMDASLWPQVLEEVVDYTQSNTAIFIALDQLNPIYDFVIPYNLPVEGLRAYEDEKIKIIDMKIHTHLWNDKNVGAVIKHNVLIYKDMLGTDEHLFYEKCAKPANIACFGGVLLERGKYCWSVLGIHRTPQQLDYEQIELDILKRLGTHLRRALQIHRQFVLLKQENLDLYHLLDKLNTGIMILNEHSSMIFANLQAKKILENSKLLELDQYNRLKTLNKYQMDLNQHILGALFHSELIEQDSKIGGVVALIHPDEKKHLMLSILPFSDALTLTRGTLNDGRKAVIFITEPNQQHCLAISYLKQVYQLSIREIKICELFVNGYNLIEIAEQCGITLSSVRTYLKNIFTKVGCNSQTELMQILMNITVDFEHIQ